MLLLNIISFCYNNVFCPPVNVDNGDNPDNIDNPNNDDNPDDDDNPGPPVFFFNILSSILRLLVVIFLSSKIGNPVFVC